MRQETEQITTRGVWYDAVDAPESREAIVMSSRWVLTDKNDPLRTEKNDLPLKANARLVVNSGDPGR